MIRIALAMVAVSMMTSGASAKSCAMSKAGGIGVTKDIASFMSNKALKDMQAKNGEKGVGAVTTNCNAGVVVDCVSAQKSCK